MYTRDKLSLCGKKGLPFHVGVSIIIFLLILTLSCDLSSLTGGGGTSNQSLIETQTALNVQMTLLAQQALTDDTATQQAIQTQSAISVAATVAAQSPTQQPPTQEQPPAAEEEATSTPEGSPVNLAGFDDWKSDAEILVYEDITGISDVKRIIKDALDALGLSFEDTKSNAGVFLDELSKTPGDNGWDLIISGVEARRGAGGGGFIEPIHDAIKNNGSAVVMEQWNIDSYSGRVADLFSECGVAYQQDFHAEGIMSAAGQVLYILDSTSPIVSEPNGDIRISNTTDYWPNFYGKGTKDFDYGDKLKKIPGSNAIFVLGLKANELDQFGTLVNCMDGRLSLLTVSTHNYTSDRMRPLWENMIYQALKARYAYLQSH